MYDNSDRRSFVPIQVGDEVEVTIESVGAKGDGVAKVKGFVLFIPGVQKGETVKVKVTKVFRKMGFAEVLGKGEASSAQESSSEKESYESDDASEEQAEEQY